MRPLEQLEMHRRKSGKGSGTPTFDIVMGHGRHCGPRRAICRVDGKRPPFGLHVSIKERKAGRMLQTARKPTMEELSFIRGLFFLPDERVTVEVSPPNRENYLVLIPLL